MSIPVTWLRRWLGITPVLLSVCALAGCGSGDGGGIASTPPPPPVAASSPSPSQTAPLPTQTILNSPYLPIAAVSNPVAPTQTFTGLGSSSGQYWPTSGIGTSVNAANSVKLVDSAAISIGRDANNGYTITVPVETTNQSLDNATSIVRTLVFGSNTRIVPSWAPNDELFIARQVASADSDPHGDRSMTIGHPEGFSSLAVGSIDLCNNLAGLGCRPSEGYATGHVKFVFGQPTQLADIPLSGTANYQGLFDLLGDAASISGDIAMSLDFTTGNLTGSLNKVEFADWYGWDEVHKSAPAIALNGLLSANGTLSGTVGSSASLGISGGTWSGQFFGPGARELGGNMLLLPSEPASRPGAFVGIFAARQK